MEIVTPLGEDVLLFHGMSAREEMSRLFEYQLDLLSTHDDVNLDDILGKNVTIKLGLPEDQTRYFNGYVTRFAQGGMHGRYHRYIATVRPWLWFLTRTSDCRIFQDMKVPDIIKSVFGDHPSADFKFELTGSYHTWTYCVQYRETDFNFVSRLMEQEGIAYYFRHADGKDTLVLTDSTSKHTPAPGYDKLSFIAPTEHVKPELEHVSAWDFAREIQPGVYVHDDYDLERPSVELKTTKLLPRQYKPSDYEVYDYPGMYLQKPDGEQYASVRINEFGSQFEMAHATTNARGLAVGSLLTLEDHPRADQNREYLVVSGSYDLSFENYESLPEGGGTSYRCAFAAMPSSQQFRPKRQTPKPFVQGPQTAVVVGPGGEEIYTDKYGRVKVQFHWDRRGTKDEKSSCWIRVSHPWAGKAFGGISLPRLGQEVIVDFLEGDPDQPIITGRVYNAEQMPPWELPANKTQSGMLTRSSLGGSAANANAIRFEDKAGSEQLWIHAEKNQDIEVENDETHSVGHDRTKTIDHDETTHVKHDRTETVDNNETITIGVDRKESVGSNETISIGADRTEDVGANETVSIGSNRDMTVGASETLTVALQRTHTVGINETITVGAAQEITVGAAQMVTVGAIQAITVGANQSTNVGANQSTNVGANRSVNVASNQSTSVGSNITASAGSDVTASAGAKFAASAGADLTAAAGGKMGLSAGADFSIVGKAKGAIDIATELVIKCGGASITLKSGGEIEIKGTDITVDGSGNVTVNAGGKIIMTASSILQN
jgi:type VI secretion system secreted protein VgrG